MAFLARYFCLIFHWVFYNHSSVKYFSSFQWFVPEGMQNSSVHHLQLSLRAKYQYKYIFTCFYLSLISCSPHQ